ncbi:MAG: dienelactone hydrolase family protein [Flavobacteriaceae bacterium]|nr:dienelactone hydrolase family protein [Flavobacteriaceae bacterium]
MKTYYLSLLILLMVLSCKNNEKETENVDEAMTETAVVEKQDPHQVSLSDSPRHHEWVDLKREDGSIMKAFVVYPETDSPAKSVIVIHENRGLNEWARIFTDQLAAEGFLVIAPDLISNTVEGVEKTTDFENSDKAREAIYALDPDQVTKDLDAAYNYIKNDKASTGNVSVMGFCWGGSQTFRYATNNPNIKEALVFYGTAPDDASVYRNIAAPIYGFYGGEDNRVNSTLEQTKKYIEQAGKKFEYEIYEGAGHAFMRSGHYPDGSEANKRAHDKAWDKLLKILNR